MKGLVVYDSVFGNTAEIARAIGAAIGTAMAAPEEVATVKVSDVKPEQLEGLAVLAVGSPTRAFKATPATMAWIRGLPANALDGVKVAAFDTRIAVEDTNSGFLKFHGQHLRVCCEADPRGAKEEGRTARLRTRGVLCQGLGGTATRRRARPSRGLGEAVGRLGAPSRGTVASGTAAEPSRFLLARRD